MPGGAFLHQVDELLVHGEDSSRELSVGAQCREDQQSCFVRRVFRESQTGADAGRHLLLPAFEADGRILDPGREAIAGDLVGGEDAVAFALEDLVEGRPRDACLVGDVGHRELGVAAARQGPRDGGHKALFLVASDEIAGKGVAPGWEPRGSPLIALNRCCCLCHRRPPRRSTGEEAWAPRTG